jgi:TonB family protein
MKKGRVHLSGAPYAENAKGKDDDAGLSLRGKSFEHLLEKSFEEKPIWAGLWENFHDAIFPTQLPPLELTSTPIALPDRMAAKTNPWAVGTATILNGGVLALVLLLGLGSTIHRLPKSTSGDPIDLKDFPLFAPASALGSHGGGSGGAHDLTDPMVGRTPRQEAMPIVPPQVQMLDNPRLPVDPAVAVSPELKLPENASLPNVGAHISPNVSLVSNGQGGPAGTGNNRGSGDGPGNGPGYGPGRDGGAGGGTYTPGVGGVSNPIAIVTPDAEFSDEARRNKYQGVCLISVIVDAHGFPRNPRVVRALGMGLDEKALEAVGRYRFKPALKDGKAVAVLITVEVNFRLY